MTREELLGKFESNSADVLTAAQREQLIAAVDVLEAASDASSLVPLSLKR